MKLTSLALASLVSVARLACGAGGGGACPDGGCTAVVHASLSTLPANALEMPPLAGSICVDGASCVTFTVTGTPSAVKCATPPGSAATCSSLGAGLDLSVPLAQDLGTHLVHLVLTDAAMAIVYDRTATAYEGPPPACGDCFEGYATFSP